MRFVIIFLFLLINNFSCKTNNKVVSAENLHERDRSEGILFLNFMIAQDSLKNIQINLIKYYWVSASFKEPAHNPMPENEALESQYLDKNQQLISKMSIENPLITSQEVFSPDGTISRQEIILQQTDFTVRSNVSREVTFIRVNDALSTIALFELK